MRKSWFRLRVIAVILLLLGCAFAQEAQPASELVESGKYRLHKFEQAIGEEAYEIRRDGTGLVLTDKFEFTDRGSSVPSPTWTWINCSIANASGSLALRAYMGNSYNGG